MTKACAYAPTHKKNPAARSGAQPRILTDEQEEGIMEVLHESELFFMPYDAAWLIDEAHKILTETNPQATRPSQTWLRGFYNRHPDARELVAMATSKKDLDREMR